jgi:hypothetical protein
MSLVVAAIYVAVLFGVGMSFVYRHRAAVVPKNGDTRNAMAPKPPQHPDDQDHRQSPLAGLR